jgi:calcium-dependent protein kinase
MEVPFGKPIEEVYDGVHDGPLLGSGISGLVRLATHKATGAKYAVKCLDLGLIETEEGLHQLRDEIGIMCQLDHPNIVRLEEVYESHSEIYLVQELCVGGELFDRLDEQPDFHYTEAQCARLIKQMLCSVRYIHSKGIIHRDLKLENFLFSTRHPDSDLKMIDFGLSKHFQYGEVQHEAVGTPYTVAPEVIRGSYDERCDVWAIGVITYLLLSGDPPFGGCGGPESMMQVRSNILRGQFKFLPEDVWANVSQDAKDFIRMLLVTDPNFRPTAKDCQRSTWLREWANKDKKKGDNKLNPNVVRALVNFKEYSDMRKLLCEVLSFTLLPDQITDLRKEFEKLDTDGSGEISLEALKKVLIQNAGAGSLGALTEEEVVDIFNAMRVRKTETRIHWHEFIAAGLSQCSVDDRNLRLAFDRLDSDHKGYITFENVMDLMGRDGAESEDAMRVMWGDSMKACKVKNAQITYEDFLLLMKGQTRDEPISTFTMMKSTKLVGGFLEPVNENHSETDVQSDDLDIEAIPSMRRSSIGSKPPTSPIGLFCRTGDEDDISEGPLDMDDLSDDENISNAADNNYMKNFTPPQTPVRSATDYVTPTSFERKKWSPTLNNISPPFLQETEFAKPDLARRRSKSYDEHDTSPKFDSITEGLPQFLADSRRAMVLPEHTHSEKEIDKIINDKEATPLVVNRKLYRAHRQMRIAVQEATKRFEEQQMKRTRAELQAQEAAKTGSVRVGAGLVMRHGHSKELSSEAIRTLLKRKKKEQEALLEVANKRGGRGRRTRKKTISDMSAMLVSVAPNEFALPSLDEQTPAHPIVKEEEEEPTVEEFDIHNLQLHETAHPKPTVPGVFKKTNDPFLSFSKIFGFGGSAPMTEETVEISSPPETKKDEPLASITSSKPNSNNGLTSLKTSASESELNTLRGPPSESPSSVTADSSTHSTRHVTDIPFPPSL